MPPFSLFFRVWFELHSFFRKVRYKSFDNSLTLYATLVRGGCSLRFVRYNFLQVLEIRHTRPIAWDTFRDSLYCRFDKFVGEDFNPKRTASHVVRRRKLKEVRRTNGHNTAVHTLTEASRSAVEDSRILESIDFFPVFLEDRYASAVERSHQGLSTGSPHHLFEFQVQGLAYL